MPYNSLLTKSIKITRLVQVSGRKMAYSTVTGSSCEIQPLTLEEAQMAEGVYGKTFKIFFDYEEDVQEGDKIRDINTGKRYQVKGKGATARSQGSISFKETIVEEYDIN